MLPLFLMQFNATLMQRNGIYEKLREAEGIIELHKK